MASGRPSPPPPPTPPASPLGVFVIVGIVSQSISQQPLETPLFGNLFRNLFGNFFWKLLSESFCKSLPSQFFFLQGSSFDATTQFPPKCFLFFTSPISLLPLVVIGYGCLVELFDSVLLLISVYRRRMDTCHHTFLKLAPSISVVYCSICKIKFLPSKWFETLNDVCPHLIKK